MIALPRKSPPTGFDALAILVVEDETMVSFLIEDMLDELGCKAVWLAGSVREALRLLDDKTPDAAVLDVNLGGEYAYPIAARLSQGSVPFIFATGYGRSGIASEWAARPVLQKPFSRDTLERALLSVLPARS